MSNIEKLTPAPILDIGRIHHGQASSLQPESQRGVKEGEGILAGRLISLVVGDDGAEGIRREDLGWSEVGLREGRLAAASDADQDHHRVGRQGNPQEREMPAGSGTGSSIPGSLLRTLLTACPTG